MRRLAPILLLALAMGCAKSTAAPVTPEGARGPVAAGANGRSVVSASAPAGYVRMLVAGLARTPAGHALLLADEARQVTVPIFIGESEALAIALRMERRVAPRPLTHDLLDALMSRLGARLVLVRIDDLQNDVFHAAVVVARGNDVIEVDSRASDAVALAVGHGIAIYVAPRVVRQAGISTRPRAAPGRAPGEPRESTETIDL